MTQPTLYRKTYEKICMKDFFKEWGYGLTGGIATGKSTVASLLRKHGYIVIDADQLSRQVVKPGSAGLSKIVAEFGVAYLLSDGTLNRQKLGESVFADKNTRDSLGAILYPLIEAELIRQLTDLGAAKSRRPWFYDASLLFERRRKFCEF